MTISFYLRVYAQSTVRISSNKLNKLKHTLSIKKGLQCTGTVFTVLYCFFACFGTSVLVVVW